MTKLVLLLLLPINVHAMLKVGIIDTGYDTVYESRMNLCKDGWQDITGVGDHSDYNGHGTNVAGLVVLNATLPKSDYCIKVYKVQDSSVHATSRLISIAIEQAIADQMDVLNISIIGRLASPLERQSVEHALKEHVIIFVAAGNDGLNLDKVCSSFPGCYSPKVIMVGNGTSNANRHQGANFGNRVTVWQPGCEQSSFNGRMCGSSMSSPIALGKGMKLIKQLRAKYGYNN